MSDDEFFLVLLGCASLLWLCSFALGVLALVLLVFTS